MHEFKYKQNEFYCEDLKVKDLAAKYKTPLYVYSYKTICDHYLKLKKAFSSIRPLICFSVKANSNLSILKMLVKRGAGLDIVSQGELYRALKAGCAANKIVYASVGKTGAEIEQAIKAGILFFNVESLPELENVNRIAGAADKKVKVALRINPDVGAKTHKFITTGKSSNKFGIDFATAYDIMQHCAYFAHLDIAGLHIHIGSQITQGKSFVEAIKKIMQFLKQLKKNNIKLRYLNIGGGLGIVYDKEEPQTATEFAAKVVPLLKKTGLKIILEPGRFIAGNAGIIVSRVLYVKKSAVKKFIISDTAMNDLMRPALYGAYHKIIPLQRKESKPGIRHMYDVVGPVCESGDFIAKARLLPEFSQGDLFAVMSSGAYGFSMSSNYNSRLRAAEVLVVKNKAYLIRKRETNKDLIRNEIIPHL